MSVQSEITRLENAKSDIATAITNKGVTVPSGTKLDGMAALIGSIESGGGGGGGGGSGAGFSVTFPADNGTNYANWSKLLVAYIIKSDGTLLNITDYSTVAGKTIDGVLLFTAGESGYYGLQFTFKGKVILYSPYYADTMISIMCQEFKDTTVRNTMNTRLFDDQFFIPISDLTITSISAYNTD